MIDNDGQTISSPNFRFRGQRTWIKLEGSQKNMGDDIAQTWKVSNGKHQKTFGTRALMKWIFLLSRGPSSKSVNEGKPTAIYSRKLQRRWWDFSWVVLSQSNLVELLIRSPSLLIIGLPLGPEMPHKHKCCLKRRIRGRTRQRHKELLKVNELIWKRTHNGLANKHAPKPTPQQDKLSAQTESHGELESMIGKV